MRTKTHWSISVDDPQMREQLKTMKPGDAVAVTFTEAVATSLATRKGSGSIR